MVSQIFKKKIPIRLLYSLLDEICVKRDNYYVFDQVSFKKGMFNGMIADFLKSCEEYYHDSKKKYVEKKLSYNTFTTVLRQMCNYNKTTYTSMIKYEKSKYDIIYYVYFST